jgi:polysaccharide biosynthesis/export protein
MKQFFLERLLIITTTCLIFSFTASALPRQQTPPPANPPAQNPPGANQNQKNQPNPNTPPGQNVPPSENKSAAPPAGGAPVDSNSYKVGPGDVLWIRVWDEGRMSGTVPVQQNGKITMELLGDMDVGGKTPNEIQEMLTQAMKKYVTKPLVTVTVWEVGSKKYYLDGLFARPGEYPLVTPTTILEAISRAGGLQDFANAKKIYVLRGDKRIYYNHKDVLKGKHMEQNIQLEPGDHLVAQ